MLLYQNMDRFLEGRKCRLVNSVSLAQVATYTLPVKLCYLVVARLLPISFSTFLIPQSTGLSICKRSMKLLVLPTSMHCFESQMTYCL